MLNWDYFTAILLILSHVNGFFEMFKSPSSDFQTDLEHFDVQNAFALSKLFLRIIQQFAFHLSTMLHFLVLT